MASTSAGAAIVELEAGLQAMQSLKPPGVSGSRINSLTKLCLDNIQSESVIITKLYTHFKKTPISHKLGVLYVIDSVTRKWLEQSKIYGQPVDGSATDGTYAAGVYRVTELMPALMNDILQSVPESQKDKISKLLDIWEKGHTFSPAMIESFRTKLKAAPEAIQSTTPEGSPPPSLVAFMGYNRPAAPIRPAAPSAQDSNAIIAALANLAHQNNSAPPAPARPAVQNPAQSASALNVLSNLQNVASQHRQSSTVSHAQPQYSMPPITQPAATAMFPFAPHQPLAQPQTLPVGMPFAPLQPPVAPVLDPQAQQQLLLIKTLVDQGVPFDKIPTFLAAFSSSQASAAPTIPAVSAPAASSAPATAAAQNYYATGQGWTGSAQSNDMRDQHRYGDGPRSPPRYRGRSRSRSPGRRWDSHDSPQGNRSQGSDYGRRSSSRSRRDDRDVRGRGNDYRHRSPVGRSGRSPTPRRDSGEKWVDFDRSLGKGQIKVLSRTLFVGGVVYTERELREIFGKYGQVQTCIVNKEKRHAFVKMMSRQDAVRAKEGMDANRDGDPQLRTRWGVGFGPRDCSDYQTGISIIPITKLTEADRKWMLTAEYGGSGGRPIETGLVVEEPDIEIGAGVSSKAISRRMQTDKSGNHGPRSTRGGRDEDREDSGRWRKGRDRRDDNKASGANAQPLPQQFPFGINTLPNGMPQYPADFAFPAPSSK